MLKRPGTKIHILDSQYIPLELLPPEFIHSNDIPLKQLGNCISKTMEDLNSK